MTVSKYLLKGGKKYYVRPMWDYFSDSGRCGTILKCDILDVLKDEAAPVVHARWVTTDNPNYSPFDGSFPLTFICSNCNYEGITSSNYCPDCGAKMDRKE